MRASPPPPPPARSCRAKPGDGPCPGNTRQSCASLRVITALFQHSVADASDDLVMAQTGKHSQHTVQTRVEITSHELKDTDESWPWARMAPLSRCHGGAAQTRHHHPLSAVKKWAIRGYYEELVWFLLSRDVISASRCWRAACERWCRCGAVCGGCACCWQQEPVCRGSGVACGMVRLQQSGTEWHATRYATPRRGPLQW